MTTNHNQVILRLDHVSKVFGGLEAIKGVDLEVGDGEIVGLIGPNGAGKTTAFNLISGVMKPTLGKIYLNGDDITHLKPYKIVKRGLVRTFQASNILFNEFTVTENVLLSRHLHVGTGLFADLLNTPFARRKNKAAFKKAAEIVDFIGLSKYSDELAKSLPHGHQRTLGIGIALGPDPKVLMLDEPTSGMNMEEKETIMHLVRQIHNRGISVLLVEHDMKFVMGLCSRIAVLNFGVKIAEGTPDEIRANDQVIEAYLGVD